LLCYALALLGKETGISFLPMLLLVYFFHRREASLRRFLWLASGYGAVTVAYLWVRMYAGARQPSIGTTWYHFSVSPLNAITHEAMLFFAALTPVSTMELFFASADRNWTLIGSSVVVVLAIVAVLCWGAYHGGRLKLLIWCAVLGVLSTLPVVALNHVSELYSYNTVPFIAGAVSVGFSGAAEGGGSHRARRWLLTLAIIGLLTAQGLSARAKTLAMEATGAEARRLTPAVLRAVAEVPPGGCLVLRSARGPERHYSVFRVRGPKVFLHAGGGLARLAGRPDVRIWTEGQRRPESTLGERACRSVVLPERSSD
jgi:hypothetical protein